MPTRTVGSQSAGLYPDHSDIYAVRCTNNAMLGSTSVQEAQDMTVVAHCAAVATRVPFVHFMDGWY